MTSLFIFVVHSIIEIFFNQIWTNTREAQITINTEQIIKFQSANNMPESVLVCVTGQQYVQYVYSSMVWHYTNYKLKVHAQSIW